MNIFKRRKYELANGTLRHTVTSKRDPGGDLIKIEGEVQRLVNNKWRCRWYKTVQCESSDWTLQLQLMRDSVSYKIKELKQHDHLFDI